MKSRRKMLSGRRLKVAAFPLIACCGPVIGVRCNKEAPQWEEA